MIRVYPLFYIYILPKENNKEVFVIKEIADSQATIEPPKNGKIFHSVPTAKM